MSTRYNIILEFPDTDEGYNVQETFEFWADEVLSPGMEMLCELQENRLILDHITFMDARATLKWVDRHPSVKKKILQITEYTTEISELPQA